MIAQYGYYDTVSGSLWGADEADVRNEQLGIELDDLSSTHAGLNVIVELRKSHTLAEIRDMDVTAFRKALDKRWQKHPVSEELARQYQVEVP